MARKVIDYTIETEGRDKGKVFQITEMSAAQAERWALRAFQAMAKGGVDVPDLIGAGMAEFAIAGIRGLSYASYHEVEPLLAEMMACVRIKPDANNPSVVRDLIETDIEELKTRLDLRAEWLNLHTGFLQAGDPSTSA